MGEGIVDEVGEVVAKVLDVFDGGEITVGGAPVGDGVGNAVDQLPQAGLALGRALPSVEILAGDDVGGGLRPVARDLDIALLEDRLAFFVGDGRRASLPLDGVVGALAPSRCLVK